MELKRRLALSAMLVAAGLATGHFVQTRAEKQRLQQAAAAAAEPRAITAVAAGATAGAPFEAPAPQADAGAPEVAVPDVPPGQTPIVEPATVAADAGDAAPIEIAALADEAAPFAPTAEPAIVLPPAATVTTPLPSAEPSAPPAPTAEGDCAILLDLVAQENAMVGLTLTAPCRPDQRVVIRHGGLVFTARTSASGSVFTSVPAMETEAAVSVLFGDGEAVEASVEAPDLAGFRRFAVQWLADDAFQLHAFEAGADYGMPGHVSATDPRQPLPGVPAAGGFLTLLGDGAVDLPMLAEVYTYPAAADVPVEVVIEAAVTEATCGRDLLGETLTSVGGESFVTELTVAMPDCDAAGDILVLKNLVPDLKLAKSE
ncbi:hypothetical protein E7811_06840 [Aliigemmobacter aestuarii]|uniref:Translocase n=1 Tax=Aliigemmobacter aestuarii TaxID=1445661 RepID=A0A4S3MSG3_9RHOB|nr:hypothetical protein [Gemmobacter aestuarii]THD85407.1 hypothetical protein E7811_06840 [Gemmobacter aestuarii]